MDGRLSKRGTATLRGIGVYKPLEAIQMLTPGAGALSAIIRGGDSILKSRRLRAVYPGSIEDISLQQLKAFSSRPPKGIQVKITGPVSENKELNERNDANGLIFHFDSTVFLMTYDYSVRLPAPTRVKYWVWLEVRDSKKPGKTLWRKQCAYLETKSESQRLTFDEYLENNGAVLKHRIGEAIEACNDQFIKAFDTP